MRFTRKSRRSRNLQIRKRECGDWADLVMDNDFDNFLNNQAWTRYWEKSVQMGDSPQLEYQMIKDVKKRGFLLYCLNDSYRSSSYTLEERYLPREERPPMGPGVFIELALVDRKHRRKNVLTQMFNKLKHIFPHLPISLESRESAFPIWQKLGFVHDPFRPDCPLHIVYFPKSK